MTVIFVALLALPLAASLLAAADVAGGSRSLGRRRAVAQVGAAASGGSLVLASVLAVAAAHHLPVTTGLGGGAVVGLTADRLGVALLLLIFAVSAVVQSFGRRYLAGDERSSWFTAAASLVTAASALLVTSTTLLTLAASWTLAGAGLCLLLGTYRTLPSARDGVGRTVRAFLIGDTALWVAVVVITARSGSVRLDQLGAHQLTGDLGRHPVLAGGVGCLIVVAALSRSAQLPFQSWLPATLAAPTPVSALLHAGVVNAGAVLLIRLSPLVRPEPLAMGLAFTAGALTAGYGTALMLTKSDIKGALAHSTMGQMGFMIMTCGLGLYAVAVFHLVAHGLYKATLFLSSGSAIARYRRHRASLPLPSTGRRRSAALVAAALVLPGLALLAAVSLLPLPRGTGYASSVALLAFGWASASAATYAWLLRHPHTGGAVGVAAFIGAAACGYVALVEGSARYLAPSLPTTAPIRGAPWLIAAVAIVLAGSRLLRGEPRAGAAGHWQRRLYVLALTAGHVRPRPRSVTSLNSTVRIASSSLAGVRSGESVPAGTRL